MVYSFFGPRFIGFAAELDEFEGWEAWAGKKGCLVIVSAAPPFKL